MQKIGGIEEMKSMIDIYDLLKQYGIIIYTKDRIGDLFLMEEEIKELYKAKVIEPKTFQTALLIIKQEISRLEKERT